MSNNIDSASDPDAVTHGIREWQKVKLAAEEAIERARLAGEEAAFYRGQYEVLAQQRKIDEARLRSMQQHCDEMELMISALGASVVSIIEKKKAGFFRRPGSVEVNGSGGENKHGPGLSLESNLRELARKSAATI